MNRITKIDELIITPEWESWAETNAPAVRLDLEIDRFKDWLASKGKRQRDYAAGFRNWVRKAQEYMDAQTGNRQGPRHHGRREAAAAAILNRARRS